MKRSQLLIAVVAIVAVALVAALAGGGGDDGGSSSSEGGSGPAAPAGAVRVSFAYSPEKEKLLKPLIRRFNSQREQVNGKPVFVEGEIVSSGPISAQRRPSPWRMVSSRPWTEQTPSLTSRNASASSTA